MSQTSANGLGLQLPGEWMLAPSYTVVCVTHVVTEVTGSVTWMCVPSRFFQARTSAHRYVVEDCSCWMVGRCARRVGAIYEKRSALVHSGKEEVTEDYLESLDGFIESMKYSVPLGW
jgi:hypothetical protein